MNDEKKFEKITRRKQRRKLEKELQQKQDTTGDKILKAWNTRKDDNSDAIITFWD